MNIFDFILRYSSEFTTLQRKVDKMANDFTALQGEMAELRKTANETKATLLDLVNRIIALEGTATDQVTIDALVAEAKEIREGLATAEDAADDHAGTVVVPDPIPEGEGTVEARRSRNRT